MIKISQTLLTEKDDFEKQENYCHKNAYEHIPIARATTYEALSEGSPCILLTVQMTEDTKEEHELIENYSWRKYIALISRVMFNLSGNYHFQLLSLSFNEILNKSKIDGFSAKLLIKTDNKELFNDNEISVLTKAIAKELNPEETSEAFHGNIHIPESVIAPKKEIVKEEPENEANDLDDLFDNLSDNENDENVNNVFNDNNLNDLFETSDDNSETDENNLDDLFETSDGNDEADENNLDDLFNTSDDDLFRTDNDNENKTEKGNYDLFGEEDNSVDSFMHDPKENISQSDDLVEHNDIKSNNADPDIAKIDNTDLNALNALIGEINSISFFDKVFDNKEETLSEAAPDVDKENTTSLNNSDNDAIEEAEFKEDADFLPNSASKDNIDTNNEFSEKITENTSDNACSHYNEESSVMKESSNKCDLKNNLNTENIPNTEDTSNTENIPNTEDVSNTENILNTGDVSNIGDIPLLNRTNYNKVLNLDYEPDPVIVMHDVDYDVKTTFSAEKLKRVYEKVYKFYISNERGYTQRAVQGDVKKEEFLLNVKNHIETYEKIPVEDIDYIVNKIDRALFSYHVLIPAINDESISDIRITSYSNIIVKIHGTHYVVDGVGFVDNEDYINFISCILLRNKINVSYPVILFTDINFCKDYILRFNICLPEVNTPGVPYVHIRKTPKQKTDLKKLLEAKMLDKNVAAYLLDKVKTSKGIVIAGPSACGKSKLINALVDYIPKGDSILCIQESDEIFTNIHPNAYMQHIVRDDRGNAIIGLSKLGQNGLVCDSQYFIIGEIKGAEARDMLRASNTGHKCWCTVHSQSAEETIPRLADYVKLGADYSLTEAERMLKDLEVIVYMENYKIREISEIKGYDEENKHIIYERIYVKGVNGR